MDNKTKDLIQSSTYYTISQDPFIGGLIQELTVKFNTSSVPTAGITYNKKISKYELYINPDWFSKLKLEERAAVLTHEVLHFTNKHLFRLPFLDIEDKERQLYNVAADMAINQYIRNLPKGCIDVKDWKAKGGTPFPNFRSMEEYYQLIKENQEENKDKIKEYGDQPFDSHDWDKLSDDDKERMIKEARELLQRTIEKTCKNSSMIPESIKDMLQEFEEELKKLNYKAILQKAIKKSMAVKDRDSTWNRKNKRYGFYAKGTQEGKYPNLSIYIDTSGSISHTEITSFLKIMEGFLKAGNKNCMLGFWHTSLYRKKKHRLNQPIDPSWIEGGGTDADAPLKDIIEVQPDLSIILTDGYYSETNLKVPGEVIWIISNGGDVNHKNKKIGKTIPIDGISSK